MWKARNSVLLLFDFVRAPERILCSVKELSRAVVKDAVEFEIT